MTNFKNERDTRIAALQAEIDFLRSENHNDHEKAIELGDMIANAHEVSRIRVNHSNGDVYILFAGENADERLSFKLDRETAGNVTCMLDDTLQEMDEVLKTVKVLAPEVKETNPTDLLTLMQHLFAVQKKHG